MRQRLLLPFLSLILSFLGVGLLLFAVSRPCLACGSQTPPPPCGVNMSALTVNKGDSNDSWWAFLAPRDEQVAHLYLGLNNNQSASPTGFTYQIAYSGDWDPDLAGIVTPTIGTGELGPAGSKQANRTIEISVPYSATQSGVLVITATVQSTDGICVYRSPVTTTLRINELGPTVWPITPRTCPKAGAKPRLTFGIRNPSDKTETYQILASAFNPLGGTASDQFSLNGQGATATLGPLTMRPGQTKKIVVDCETFGYCMIGGENQVLLQVAPASNSTVEAVAWSNVTIRDPEAECPELKDWWFVMPPMLAVALIGVPSMLVALGGGTYVARRRRTNTPLLPPDRRDGSLIRVDKKETGPSGKDISHGKPRKRS